MQKKVNIKRVFKSRDKLFQAISPYIDFDIAADTLKNLTDDLYKVLPNNASYDALFESCRAIAGVTLTRPIAAEFVWRLAGNMELLLHGKPVIPWTRQIVDEWLPVQIMHVDPAFRRGAHGQLIRFRAISGRFCPGVFEQFVSRGACVAMSRIAGFSFAMPLANPVHFTGLRFLVHIDAARSIEQPQFDQTDCTSSMKAYNKKIIAIRLRRKPCPRNFEHACDVCPVSADSCLASVFLRGLTARYCNTCNQIRYFDTSRSEELCFSCWMDKRVKRTAGA